jgi:small subunit ribosomal protein S15
MISKTKKAKAIKEVARHATDTGSSEVQVAILTKRIEELASHLKDHKKDIHSRRGLLSMVADRQKHLKYLAKKHPKGYSSVIKKLELKK